MGYAESLANSRLFSVYAETITIAPSPIAFGLPHVYLMSFLIRAGVDAYYAYDIIFIFWILLSFFSCYKICRFLNIDSKLSAVLPVFLLTLPAILEHHGYSVLGIGYMLTPFYIYTALCLFKAAGIKAKIIPSLCFVLMVTVALFNDGYSFIMTMVLVGGVYLAFFNKKNWRMHLFYDSMVIIAGTLIAYMLYTLFIGQSSWSPWPRNVFNTFQAFFTSYLIPTKNSWSILGEYFSYKHPTLQNYTQNCYFCVPLLIANIILLFSSGKKLFCKWQYWMLWAMVIGGVWLSLGPDMALINGNTFSTGNWFIYKNLPGFKIMRATARWGIFVNILLVFMFYISIKSSNLKKHTIAVIICSVYFLNFLPSPLCIKSMRWSYGFEMKLRQILEKDLEGKIHKGETVFFIPFRNHFAHLYWGSVNGADTWNTGCDKNVQMLIEALPDELVTFADNAFETKMKSHLQKWNASDIVEALLFTEIDVIIFDYNSACPIAHPSFKDPMKNDAFKLEKYLKKLNCLDITHSKHFSYYRLNQVWKKYKKLPEKEKTALFDDLEIVFLNNVLSKIPLNKTLKLNDITEWARKFHGHEPQGRWASSECELTLPIEKSVQGDLLFTFNGWPISQNQVVIIKNYQNKVLKTIPLSKAGKYSFIVSQKDLQKNILKLKMEFPHARKPGNRDQRILSFFFYDIKLTALKEKKSAE